MEGVIIEMTPFIFEDGDAYYFQIVKRGYTNDYHDLFVYKKIVNESKNLFGKIKKTEHFECINEKEPELISTKLNTSEIKSDIKKIIIAKKATHQLKDWDGFVGNVPEEVKKSLKRDADLKNLLDE